MEDLTSIIESILFVSAKPQSTADLARLLRSEEQEVLAALQALAKNRQDNGVILLEAGGQWQFATNPKNSAAVRAFLNAELREKLTDATIETLAIIAYRQPISRTEIETIRGVNSQYSIRNLLIRGLIQKIPNPLDNRQILYETSIEFLSHMGLSSNNELPDFESILQGLQLPTLSPEKSAESEAGDSVKNGSENEILENSSQ
jgi:segregation and condensation protein B